MQGFTKQEELYLYIQELRGQGISDKHIESHLIEAGWDQDTVYRLLHGGASQTKKQKKSTRRIHKLPLGAIAVWSIVAVLIFGSIGAVLSLRSSNTNNEEPLADAVPARISGFSFSPPSQWQPEAEYTQQNRTQYYFSPEDALSNERDKAARLSIFSGTTQQGRGERNLNQLNESYVSDVQRGEGSQNGLEYIKLEYVISQPGAADQRVVVFEAVTGNDAVVLEIRASDEHWNLHRDEVEELLGSVGVQ